jgi:hypothetical protein
MGLRDELIRSEKNWPYIQKAWDEGSITKSERELCAAGLMVLTPKTVAYPAKAPTPIYPGRRKELLEKAEAEVLLGLREKASLDSI